MNGMRTDSTARRLRALAAVLAIAAAGAAVLWAGPFELEKDAAPRAPESTATPAIQRLSAADLAKVDLGTAPPTEWSEPPVLRSVDRQLQAALSVAYADNVLKIGDQSQRVRFRSYNGMLTGPTLRIKAGDTLNVKFENNLPPEPKMAMHGAKCAAPTHGFNITNLHTHGLHISPSGNSDNVLLTIGGGERKDFEFKILPAGNPGSKPARQYPGTFWYHAHNHGSTAMQLASGMAGALIIEDGADDRVPEVAAAQERLFIFQQFAYKVDDQGVGRIEDFSALRRNWAALGTRTAINGRIKPLIRLRPGQVERWRWIDSGVFADLPISIASSGAGSFAIYRIALDGITRPRPERTNRVELGPGYRVDLLVKAPLEAGTYYLYKDKSTVFPSPGTDEAPAIDDNQILAQIEVSGTPCTNPQDPCATKIPDQLRPPTDMLPDIRKDEVNRPPVTVKFGLKDGFFTVNETCFDPDVIRPEFDKRVGDVEEWEIINETPAPHPFHIHVNAFQLLNADGNPGVWRDTIMVPAQVGDQPGIVRFRTRFERFDGTFVLHCHILPHEDSGMMQLVRVKPKAL